MTNEFTVWHHEKIGSTNDEARRLAAEGAPHGTAIHADEQTAPVRKQIIDLTQQMMDAVGEGKADDLHDQGLRQLFLEHADPMAFITGNEVYDHLEKVVDRFDDVANRISGVVIDHV